MAEKRFAADIGRWARGSRERLDLIVRKVAIDIFSRVVLRSPVDTGRFRANWQVAIGEVPHGVLDLTDQDGAATISRATATALGVKAGQVIWLVNNLPYGVALEYGHSQQAPGGMVRVTVEEYQATLRRAVAETKGAA